MTGSDLFWLILLVAAFYPFIKQKTLEFGRKRLLAQMEQKRKSRAIMLVHRQELRRSWLSIFRYIDITIRRGYSSHSTHGPQGTIDFILQTLAASILPSPQISRL
jgi:hypothetical protein